MDATTKQPDMRPSFLQQGIQLDKHEASALFSTLSDVQALIEIGHGDAAIDMLNQVKRIINGKATIEFLDNGFCWQIQRRFSSQWCEGKCGDEESTYMPDNTCPCGINKHHYHCTKCMKVVQIG